VWRLQEKYPEVEDTTRPRWTSKEGEEFSRIRALRVFKAFITDESKQGLGIGRAMYLAVMAEWFKKVGPFLFMPYNCSGSGTSDMALRVWASLARDFPFFWERDCSGSTADIAFDAGGFSVSGQDSGGSLLSWHLRRERQGHHEGGFDKARQARGRTCFGESPWLRSGEST
jgi:hypothetical protein